MELKKNVIIIKKDGTKDIFNGDKIKIAVSKSAKRVMITLSDIDKNFIVDNIVDYINNNNIGDFNVLTNKIEIQVADIHRMVEMSLEKVNPVVCKSYKDYRNYKTEFIHILDDVYTKSQAIRFIGDKSNANTDSALVATKRCLIFNELNKELYRKFFMTREELEACRDGYIYVHDQSARNDTFNCFRRDTRFITKSGVKSFYDFSDGDLTMVLSHTGKWRRAIVRKYGWQPMNKVTLSKGTPTSKKREIYCTPNHRWILKDGTETTNLSIGDILWQVPDITKFDWDSLSLEDKKLWCKGFAKGDGSLVKAKGDYRPPYTIVRLCGHKTEYAKRFRDCGYTVTENVYNGSDDLLVTMLDCTSKDIPWLNIDYSNAIYYVNGLMCADGDRTRGDNPSMEFRSIQVTGDLNDDIYTLLNVAGYYVTCTRDLTCQETNYGVRKDTTISYKVASAQSRVGAWRVENIERATLNPSAEVWCLEVEIDHSFLLEGGIPTGNCCLFDAKSVLEGGFEMGNIWYNEPKTLDTFFDVLGDVILSTAAQQYGGFTIPRIDELSEKYAHLSYEMHYNKYFEIREIDINNATELIKEKADKYAESEVEEEYVAGWKGLEYKLNTVGSSRGETLISA